MTLLEKIKHARRRCSEENAKLELLLSELERAMGEPAFIDPTVLLVQETVASHYGLGVQMMRSTIKTIPVAKARMMAMALTYELTGMTDEQIAPYYCKDRNTITYARAQIASRCQVEHIFAHEFETLKSSLQTRLNRSSLQQVVHA